MKLLRAMVRDDEAPVCDLMGVFTIRLPVRSQSAVPSKV